MTIYLWHMPALVLFAALLFAGGVPFPDPLSPLWWATRPAWLLGVGCATALLVLIAQRFERRPAVTATASGRRTAVAVSLAMAGVVAVLIGGFTPVTAVIAIGCLVAALRLTSGASRSTSGASPVAIGGSHPQSARRV